MRNMSTLWPSKKLDVRSARYQVIERVGSHAYRLALPPESKVHPVFHTMLLCKAATDPFPLQDVTPHCPPPVIIGGREEYEVEAIRGEREGGRGKEYLVTWRGYQEETWEPSEAFEDTAALDAWERRPKDARSRRVRRRR